MYILNDLFILMVLVQKKFEWLEERFEICNFYLNSDFFHKFVLNTASIIMILQRQNAILYGDRIARKHLWYTKQG